MSCPKNDPACGMSAAISISGVDVKTITKDQLRTTCRMGLQIAAALAKLTSTDLDDKGVAILQSVVDNDAAWNLICNLLGLTDTPTPAPDNGDDSLRLMGAAPVEAIDWDRYIPEHLPPGVTREMVREKLKERYGDMKAIPIGLIGLIIQIVIALLTRNK